MKFWALGAMVLSVAALAACKGDGTTSSTGGEGGNGGSGGSGGGTVTSTGTKPPTTSSTMTDPCEDGSDCSQCPDGDSCFQCEIANHSEGAQIFNTFGQCILCTACYTACNGAQAGCPMAPAMKAAGDSDMGGQAACNDGMGGGCAPCAQMMGATCADEAAACAMNADCVDFNNAIQACPM